ncbi:PEP-CTERM sorting domain-containing protein [Aquabacterium humicola]|uniref:PEP-CTERM sorting domain-containing protein n=1 Tax=Aquabacterium humicola TaxID=3237377 RepID=UPI002543639C|nr:PEP-CTERM sorting domain-containing protein [Rubrivivax pictus]
MLDQLLATLPDIALRARLARMTTPLAKACAAVAAAVTLSGAGHAALIDRGSGMIYDTTLNLTWLADMNYAKTTGYDADGKMNPDDALLWANDLVYGGYDDWRLPNLNPFDSSCSASFHPGGGYGVMYQGWNCVGGELSHLFWVDLGIKVGESVLNSTGDTSEQVANLALFSNVQDSTLVSGTDYAPDSVFWWYLSIYPGGGQFIGEKLTSQGMALAVRRGDVSGCGDSSHGCTVPEPQTLLLALMALGASVLAARRRPPR